MTPPDPDGWLRRFTPMEWIRRASAELAQAKAAYAGLDRRGGLVGARRAAGVALNGWLSVMPAPDPAYGRTYMEHLAALAVDPRVPAVVREAAESLRNAPLPGGDLVLLQTPSAAAAVTDAAETVIAHALAEVLRATPPAGD